MVGSVTKPNVKVKLEKVLVKAKPGQIVQKRLVRPLKSSYSTLKKLFKVEKTKVSSSLFGTKNDFLEQF